ncbi:MAG: hypothetical protein K6G50_05835 [bacterium]|nr:hypothetical protein [bacterium]
MESICGQKQELYPGKALATSSGDTVRNIAVPLLPAEILYFSDHPERVAYPGRLFDGALIPLKTVRFQAYHEGGREKPLTLKAYVISKGDKPAKIHIIEGAGGPDPDYFPAGHDNNLRFLDALTRGEGRIYEIPPHERAEILCQPLPNLEVISATQQITLLEGRAELVFCALDSPDSEPSLSLLAKKEDVHARGAYPEAYHHGDFSWNITEPENFIAIGATRQDNIAGATELRGDYGVLYDIDITLKNPGENAEIEVLFNPRGGKATFTGIAYLDGAKEIWEIKDQTEAFERVPLARINMPAQSTRRLKLLTIPEGASNYPVRLVFHKNAEESSKTPEEAGKAPAKTNTEPEEAIKAQKEANIIPEGNSKTLEATK